MSSFFSVWLPRRDVDSGAKECVICYWFNVYSVAYVDLLQ